MSRDTKLTQFVIVLHATVDLEGRVSYMVVDNPNTPVTTGTLLIDGSYQKNGTAHSIVKSMVMRDLVDLLDR